MAINKQLLIQLRNELDNVLPAIGKKFGIKLAAGNASFNENEATMKLMITALAVDGKVVDKYAATLKEYGVMFGLPANCAGKTIWWAGKQLTICGLNTRKYRQPVILSDTKGKRWVMRVEDVLKALGGKNANQDMLEHCSGKDSIEEVEGVS